MLLGPRSKLARIWPKIASHAGYTFARDMLGEMLKRATCALCMVALHGSVPHRRCRVRLLLCRRCCVDLDALMLPHSLHSLPCALPLCRTRASKRAHHGRPSASSWHHCCALPLHQLASPSPSLCHATSILSLRRPCRRLQPRPPEPCPLSPPAAAAKQLLAVVGHGWP